LGEPPVRAIQFRSGLRTVGGDLFPTQRQTVRSAPFSDKPSSGPLLEQVVMECILWLHLQFSLSASVQLEHAQLNVSFWIRDRASGLSGSIELAMRAVSRVVSERRGVQGATHLDEGPSPQLQGLRTFPRAMRRKTSCLGKTELPPQRIRPLNVLPDQMTKGLHRPVERHDVREWSELSGSWGKPWARALEPAKIVVGSPKCSELNTRLLFGHKVHPGGRHPWRTSKSSTDRWTIR